MGKRRILVSLVEKSLRQQIKNGKFSPGDSLPTFRQLAQVHNISLASVQQAVKKLQKQGLVSVYQGRGAIVRGKSDVWRPLNFRKVLSSPTIGIGKQVGLFVSKIYRGYTSQIMPDYIQGIADELYNWNIDLNLFMLPEDETSSEYCLQKLHHPSLTGLILMKIENLEKIITAVQKLKIPFVLLSVKKPEYQRDNLRYVIADEKKGVEEAISFLINLGHFRIAYLGEKGINCIRYNAYLETIRKYEIPFNKNLIISVEDDKKAISEGMRNLFLNKDLPTAIFCDNDYKALEVMEAAKGMGLSIPREISVIGFDNIPAAAQANPPLTTIYKPRYEMGREAAHILSSLILNCNGPITSKKILKTYLVHRDSCTGVNKSSALIGGFNQDVLKRPVDIDKE